MIEIRDSSSPALLNHSPRVQRTPTKAARRRRAHECSSRAARAEHRRPRGLSEMQEPRVRADRAGTFEHGSPGGIHRKRSRQIEHFIPMAHLGVLTKLFRFLTDVTLKRASSPGRTRSCAVPHAGARRAQAIRSDGGGCATGRTRAVRPRGLRGAAPDFPPHLCHPLGRGASSRASQQGLAEASWTFRKFRWGPCGIAWRGRGPPARRRRKRPIARTALHGQGADDYFNRPNATAHRGEPRAARRVSRDRPISGARHGPSATQGPPRDQFDPPPAQLRVRGPVRASRRQLFWIIRFGSPGTSMPAHGKFDDERIWQLVLHLRRLAR